MKGQSTSLIDQRAFLQSLEEPNPPCIVFIHPAGPLMGVRVTLDAREYVLGRGSEADIRIDSPTVSRVHAKLLRTRDGWEIRDQGSTNGVVVNNQDLRARHVLRDRDIITLGDTSFKFLSGNNVEAAYHDLVYRLTIMDALTQIYNRRHFFDSLEREISITRRHKTPLSIVMMDLDHFKDVNDTYGHLVGDQILKGVADRIRPKIRREDLFARYGGEEFVILLVHTEKHAAIKFAEKIGAIVRETPFHVDDRHITITVSMGVATYTGKRKTDPATLVEQADRNLYRAKARGRDRVVG